MLRLVTLQLVLFLFVVTSARKQMIKISPDAVEELRGKTVDEGLQGIAVQKQLFRDIFAERQLGNKLQFGHICEDPIEWEQRFEEKDFSKNRHRGKVKWANVDGTYGEHYWDINH
ncbi:uncharacterized protein LOC143348022 [Colletes latitarsis]|uniref:uncharacterized protein LOC143348022 n=1 Tax=Colletes latitarsis TaxID=2605962 RepID=UPI004036915B